MIEIENLSFGYKKEASLFKELSLSLPTGNIYGLLGQNGAGKSTLLKIMAGLLFPKDGEILIEGYRPKDRYPQFLREVFLVTEEFKLPCVDSGKFEDLYSPFYPRFNYETFAQYLDEFKIPKDKSS